jgi:transaldolase
MSAGPKIFYDGADIAKFGGQAGVVGFTTNTSIMRQAGQLNYTAFYRANDAVIAGRPISFQVFADEAAEVEVQARAISAIGPNIYVKVPIINSRGDYLLPVIEKLLADGIKVNITAIFTGAQIEAIAQSSVANTTTPTIVSVFAGRISDTGVNPKCLIADAVAVFRGNAAIEILWAGCKDNLVLQNCRDVGCQIATLPDAIMQRINRIGQPLTSLSQDTVTSFLKDAVDGGIVIA